MKNLKRLFHGALCLLDAEGYVIPRRFTEEQTSILTYNEVFYDRSRCGASITLCLVTEATEISFAYKIFFRTGVENTFEIYTNGRLTHMVKDSEIPDEGTLDFAFEAGRKQIEIYLPAYSETGLKDLRVNASYTAMRKKKTRVLFIGDSITQGGGSNRSSQTYVNVVKRSLGYEIVNQGIGGYCFDKRVLAELPFSPDKIVVAFGTNHVHWPDQQNQNDIEGFFEVLAVRYPGVKVLVVLHPYHGTEKDAAVRDKYTVIRKMITDEASKYPNVLLTSAYDMIPHFVNYYMDDFVHPNALGMEVYGNNLVKEIKRIGF